MHRCQSRLPSGAIFAFSLTIALLAPQPAQATLSLYLGDQPAPAFAAYTLLDPLPTLGVHSTSTGPWSGRAASIGFPLYSGQVNTALNPAGLPLIWNDGPDVCRMLSQGFEYPGIQFTMEMDYSSGFESLIALYDHSTTFDVPVDTLGIYRGGGSVLPPSFITPDANGPYVLGPGGTVAFDATGSTATFEPEGMPAYSMPVRPTNALAYWRLAGVDIAFGLNPTISYDTLVNGLSLDPGYYDLTLALTADGYSETAVTTLHVLPEPATFSLLLLTAAAYRRRR